MHQYTDEPWVGCILTFLTVLCLYGINEVARDLECPFRSYPNDLPLLNFQAQFNEALITMFAGYHPDFYWNGDQVMRIANVKRTSKKSMNPVEMRRTTSFTHTASKPKFTTGTQESTEIAELKRKLEQQSKVIEQLVAKIGPSDEEL